MELAQSRLEDKPNDPGPLYALGVRYRLRGNYDFAVRKAYLDALHDIGRARKFHNRVTRIDPAMVDAQLTQGVYHYVVRDLPPRAPFHGCDRRSEAPHGTGTAHYLLRLELAEMYGDLADRGAALDALDQVEQLRRVHAPGYGTLRADLLRQVRERILINIYQNSTIAGG